jgi:succinyldiaminopimelate transaminase
MNPAIFSVPPNPMERLDALREELRRAGREVFDFGIGDPREPTPAFIVKTLRDSVPAVSQYPRVAGTPELRSAVAGYLARRFNVKLDPETQILPSAGAKEAIFHLASCLVDPHSERRIVLYPDPGYPIYERGAVFAGAEPRAIPLNRDNRFLMDVRRLPDSLLSKTAILWICSPHNPTGSVMPSSSLRAIADAAERHGFVVASDECYADVYADEKPHSALEVSTSRVVVFHSLSKRSGMTGMRSGFMAGDAALIAALRRFRPSIGTASPDFIQAAATEAWQDDSHVTERRAVFSQKRVLLLDTLRTLGLEVVASEAGLYLWIAIPANHGDDDAAYAETLARNTGIIVQPGSYLGASGRGFVRLSLSPTLEECRRAADTWRSHVSV